MTTAANTVTLLEKSAGRDEAASRHAVAFGPTFRVPLNKITRREAEDFNSIVLDRLAVLVPAREKIADRLQAQLADEFARDFLTLTKNFDKHDLWTELAKDALDVYQSVRRRDRDDKTTKAEVREYLRENEKGVNARIDRIVRRANERGLFDGSRETILLHMVLIAESGAKFLVRSLRGDLDSITKEILFGYEKAASPADKFLLYYTLGEGDFPPLPASAQMGELLDSIQKRTNEITLGGFNDKMFETVRGTIKENLYEAVDGGKGAAEIARQLGKELRAKFADLPKEANNRLMLWARTEGAVVQNDALMARGEDVGMDGKIWQTVGDSRVRDAHIMNEGAGVIPMADTFPDGSTDGGAGSVSPFNCFHPSQKVCGDYIGAQRVLYAGELLTIKTRKGHSVVCTPNHPILTDKGFRRAKLIECGSNLVCGPPQVSAGRMTTAREENEHDEVSIEKMFETLRKRGELHGHNVAPLDFYEDGQRCVGKIDVVRSDRCLLDEDDSMFFKKSLKRLLALPLQRLVRAAHLSIHECRITSHVTPLDFLLVGGSSLSDSKHEKVSIYGASRAFEHLRDLVHAHLLCDIHLSKTSERDVYSSRSALTYGNPLLAENAIDDSLVAGELLAQLRSRFSGEITFDDVVSVHSEQYSGYVYDLESVTGLMVLRGGIVCKQCRCAVGPALLPSKRSKKEGDKPKKPKDTTPTTTPKAPRVPKPKPTGTPSPVKGKITEDELLEVPKGGTFEERLARAQERNEGVKETWDDLLSRAPALGTKAPELEALLDYKGTMYSDIQAVLRNDVGRLSKLNPEALARAEENAELIKGAFDKYGVALDKDTTLYRVVRSDYEGNPLDKKIGEVLTEAGFSSTSLNVTRAMQGGNKFDADIILRIHVPSGTKVMPVNAYHPSLKEEREILLNADTKLKITNISEIVGERSGKATYTHVVDVEVV